MKIHVIDNNKMSKEIREHYLTEAQKNVNIKLAVMNCLQDLDEANVQFPNNFLSTSWRDASDGVEMGIDDPIEIASMIKKYIIKLLDDSSISNFKKATLKRDLEELSNFC